MVTVMKNRTTDVNRFFSDLVDFTIYVVRSGGATIFLSRFASGPDKPEICHLTAEIKKGLAKPYFTGRL
jgi:hypothetical protein